MWQCTIPMDVFSRLIFGALAVSKEAYIRVHDVSMRVEALNAANTMYCRIETASPVFDPPLSEPESMAFDMQYIATAMPQKESDIKLEYEWGTLKMIVGRSRFKFRQFADSAVRSIPDNLVRDMPNVVQNVDVKSMYEANNRILKMSDVDGSLYKTRIDVKDGTLTVSDKEGNIVTDLDCDTDAPSSNVTVSTAYLETVLSYVKKYIAEPIQIQMYTPESPVIFRYTGDKGRMYFLVAPIVEVD